jgi:hypothetical protein
VKLLAFFGLISNSVTADCRIRPPGDKIELTEIKFRLSVRFFACLLSVKIYADFRSDL